VRGGARARKPGGISLSLGACGREPAHARRYVDGGDGDSPVARARAVQWAGAAAEPLRPRIPRSPWPLGVAPVPSRQRGSDSREISPALLVMTLLPGGRARLGNPRFSTLLAPGGICRGHVYILVLACSCPWRRGGF
jgi:hypothetical protein